MALQRVESLFSVCVLLPKKRKARQNKAKPSTAIASRSHFYMLLMMMIECEKRYFKLCTCSGVDGANDDDDGGGAVSFFANLFIQNLTLNCGANVFYSGLTLAPDEFFCISTDFFAHRNFAYTLLLLNGTKVCTENQSRCSSFSHCLL